VQKPLKWAEKLDRDGKVIPRCWVTQDGYTVAECRLPAVRYIVTRPGAVNPFGYCCCRDEVVRLIGDDMKPEGEC
jgi:hypothetical protein